MKNYLVICFLAIFLISTKSNSDELKSPKNENQTSFETLKTMIQYLDERLSKLEEKSQKEEMQLQDPDSDHALRKSAIAKVNQRLAKIEKTISTLEIKETLKSFEGTLDVFKKRFSDISKRLEDSEINAAVIEKMYRKTLDYVEPPKSTVSKAREGQSQIVNKDSVDIVKTENAEELKKPKTFKKLTESRELKGLRTSIVPNALAKSKASQDIGNGFSAENVTFDKYDSSSIIKGEIKNNSDSDITTASFIMKLFGENGRMIAEFDFHIRKVASNTIKPFEETVRGVLPSQISRYEIKCRSSF